MSKQYSCSDATRSALLEAVIQLSRDQEYDSVTVRQICRQAGVSNGAFYHHYANKDQLVLQAFLDFDRAVTPDLVSQCESMLPMESLYFMFRNYLEYIQDQVGRAMPSYYRVLLKGESREYRNPQRPFLRAMRFHCMRCQDAGLLTKDYTADELVDLFSQYLRGLLFDWCLCGCTGALWPRAERDLHYWMRGLSPQGGANAL